MFSIFNGTRRVLGDAPEREIELKIHVDFRQYLKHFKGAKLAVFLAIALHMDKGGWASPTINQLHTETGYDDGTITPAITDLCKMVIDGQRVMLAVQQRDKGRFVKNRYLVLPTAAEITRHEAQPEARHPRQPRPEKPSTEKQVTEEPSTVLPNTENPAHGINSHSLDESPGVEESQSVSLRSTDCARDPQPEPTPEDYTAALAKHGAGPGAVITQGNTVIGTLGNPEPPTPQEAPADPPSPPSDSWNLVNLDTREIVETFTNPILARQRTKDLNAIGGAKYVTRIVKADRKPPPKPWSALTTAMHEAIPSAIRPPRCHYGKNDKAARALHEAGFTAQEVSEFVLWSYDYDPWLMSGGTGGAAIPATMYYVETHIKPWKAKHNGTDSHSADRFAPPPGVRFARPAP